MGEAAALTASRPLLQVERLTKLYPVRQGLFRKATFLRALDSITFYIKRGETLGLVGESGCGKTTLARTVLRLVEPTFGRIIYDGQELGPLSQKALRPLRRHMQPIFQDPYGSLNPRMTVGDIVSEGPRIHKLAKDPAQLREQVQATLESVGLSSEVMGRYPHEFSAGQRQRIGIARALAVGPSLVVCDEPVSALDLSVRAQILNLLTELQQKKSLSYLFISHDLRAVEHISHRVAVMYLGRLVEVGPTERVLSQPGHPYTRALLSAVPVADPQQRRLRLLLEGEPPSALHPPSGCPFHPRCPRNDQKRCVEQVPVLQELSPASHHRAACFYPGEGSPQRRGLP